MRAHSRPLVVAGETRKQILRLIVAAARKLTFVGPKAMLFGMPVAEKLQSAMGLQCRLDEGTCGLCLSYVAYSPVHAAGRSHYGYILVGSL